MGDSNGPKAQSKAPSSEYFLSPRELQDLNEMGSDERLDTLKKLERARERAAHLD